MNGHVEVRCAGGRPCEHVVALVAAGQQALHATDCPEQGRALLEHAQRLAAQHSYGQAVILEEAS